MDVHEQRTCAQRTAEIAELNDQFRNTGVGGKLFITRAVAAFEPQVVAAIIDAVREFDDFTPAIDPFGEHDLGNVMLGGVAVWWRIDCMDLQMEFASPDPADEAVTRRIMTLMTAGDM